MNTITPGIGAILIFALINHLPQNPKIPNGIILNLDSGILFSIIPLKIRWVLLWRINLL